MELVGRQARECPGQPASSWRSDDDDDDDDDDDKMASSSQSQSQSQSLTPYLRGNAHHAPWRSRFVRRALLVAAAAAALAAAAGGSGTADDQIPAIFMFGDSIVDPGNNNNRLTEARANFPPYGQDFPGGVATGRFSNGLVPGDLLGTLYVSGSTTPMMLPTCYLLHTLFRFPCHSHPYMVYIYILRRFGSEIKKLNYSIN